MYVHVRPKAIYNYVVVLIHYGLMNLFTTLVHKLTHKAAHNTFISIYTYVHDQFTKCCKLFGKVYELGGNFFAN